METIYFSLGIVTALVTILLVIGVVMVVRLTKKQTQLDSIINHIERYNQEGRNALASELEIIQRNTSNQFDEVNRELIVLNDSTHREIEKVSREAHQHVDELNKYVDSRFDKTLDQISKVIADHNKKSLLND